MKDSNTLCGSQKIKICILGQAPSVVRQFVNKLGSDILEESTMPDNKGNKSIQVIDNILKKYSFRNRVRFFIDNFSKNFRPQSPELKMIEQQAKQGIQHVMVTIKKTTR